MNKRQAKKNFKKKYGCNPKEAQDILDLVSVELPIVMQEVADALPGIIEQAVACINNYCESLVECCNALSDFMNHEDIKKIVERLADEEKL